MSACACSSTEIHLQPEYIQVTSLFLFRDRSFTIQPQKPKEDPSSTSTGAKLCAPMMGNLASFQRQEENILDTQKLLLNAYRAGEMAPWLRALALQETWDYSSSDLQGQQAHTHTEVNKSKKSFLPGCLNTVCVCLLDLNLGLTLSCDVKPHTYLHQLYLQGQSCFYSDYEAGCSLVFPGLSSHLS